MKWEGVGFHKEREHFICRLSGIILHTKEGTWAQALAGRGTAFTSVMMMPEKKVEKVCRRPKCQAKHYGLYAVPVPVLESS